MSKTPSLNRTKKNLETAFAGESMANRKYLYFAKLARQMGAEEVAKLFEDTADAETGHAHAHLALLYPADQMTVEKILEAAIAGERYEHQEMYPGFEKEAKAESEAAAVGEFQDQAAESREHDARFTAMLEQARRRFAHLTTVEKEHADRYQAALDQRNKA